MTVKHWLYFRERAQVRSDGRMTATATAVKEEPNPVYRSKK